MVIHHGFTVPGELESQYHQPLSISARSREIIAEFLRKKRKEITAEYLSNSQGFHCKSKQCHTHTGITHRHCARISDQLTIRHAAEP